MRFLLRSAFWLGLTFHAMPWRRCELADALPDPRAAIASLTAEDHDGAAAKAVVGAVLRARAQLACARPRRRAPRRLRAAKPTRPSVDTLTARRSPAAVARPRPPRDDRSGKPGRRGWPSTTA